MLSNDKTNAQNMPSQILNLEDNQMLPSQDQEVPDSLSYQSVKLVNFIELELTDLSDNLQNLREDESFKNTIQQILSRSYHLVFQMKQLYKEINGFFLYSQVKKLTKAYSKIFLKFFDHIEFLMKKNLDNTSKENNKKSIIETRRSSIKNLANGSKNSRNLTNDSKNNKNSILSRKPNHSTIISSYQPSSLRNYDKDNRSQFGGIFLYNQNYERNVEYDIDEFKQFILEKRKNQNKHKDPELLKKQKQTKFKLQIIQQLEQKTFQGINQQSIAEFYSRKKEIDLRVKSMSIGNQLNNIVEFFKKSENQAIQFLKESKSQSRFYSLVEGFNGALEQHSVQKRTHLTLLKQKTNQIFKFLARKNQTLVKQLEEKDFEIEKLKVQLLQNGSNNNHISTQTYHNFDQQIKDLYLKLIENEAIIEKQKSHYAQSLQQQKKQGSILLNKIIIKDSNNRRLKEQLQQKNNYIGTIQKKVKYLTEVNKNKANINPINYFLSLDKETKRQLMQKAKQEGILFVDHPERMKINMKVQKTKTPSSRMLFQKVSQKQEIQEAEENYEQRILDSQMKKRKNSAHSVYSNLNFSLNRTRTTPLSVDLPRPKSGGSNYNEILNSQQPRVNNYNILQPPDQNKIDRNKDEISKDQKSFKKSYKIIKKNQYITQLIEEKKAVFDTSFPKFIDSIDSKLSTFFQGSSTSKKNSLIQKISEQMNNTDSNSFQKIISFNQNSSEIEIQYIQQLPNEQSHKSLQLYDMLIKKDQYSQNDLLQPSNRKENQQERVISLEKNSEERKIGYKNEKNIQKKISKMNQKDKINTNIRKCQSDENSENNENSESGEGSQSSQNNQLRQIISNYNNRNNNSNNNNKNNSNNNRKPSYQSRILGNNQKYRSKGSIINQFDFTAKQDKDIIRNGQDLQENTKINKELRKKGKNILQIQSNAEQNQYLKRNDFKTSKKINNNLRATTDNVKQFQKEKQSEKILKKTITYALKKHGTSYNRFDIQNTNHPIEKSNQTVYKSREIQNENQSQHFKQMQKTAYNFRNSKLKLGHRMISEGNQSNFQSSDYKPTSNRLLLPNKVTKKNKQNQQNIQKLYREFKDTKILEVAKSVQNAEEFRKKIINLHKKKCGSHCSHIQRYIQIFLKIKQYTSNPNKKIIKMHIENMNDKFEFQEDQEPHRGKKFTHNIKGNKLPFIMDR